jgi:hypothetical protein
MLDWTQLYFCSQAVSSHRCKQLGPILMGLDLQIIHCKRWPFSLHEQAIRKFSHAELHSCYPQAKEDLKIKHLLYL